MRAGDACVHLLTLDNEKNEKPSTTWTEVCVCVERARFRQKTPFVVLWRVRTLPEAPLLKVVTLVEYSRG